MNILFPTISRAIQDINNRGIYPDLLRKFSQEGHQVFIVHPISRSEKTSYRKVGNVHLLGVPLREIIKSNPVEKVLATLQIGNAFKRAIGKYFAKVMFDVILYATPPITFNSLIAGLKAKHGAFCYLMLKDIFPQNAVDLGMMKKNGIVHRYFRKKERKLYTISDFIGCMSPANVEYLLEHDSYLNPSMIGLCPNAVEIKNKPLSKSEKNETRLKFGLPTEKIIVIYGGNLGKPQGIDFLLEVLSADRSSSKLFFVIAGNGTEVLKVKSVIQNQSLSNAQFFGALNREDYDELEASADIALVLLDGQFTIPNFPSRMLSYMENGLPMIFATDAVSDAGTIAEENGFGLKSAHGDLSGINQALTKLAEDAPYRIEMGTTGRLFLEQHYQVAHTYDLIMKSIHSVL